MSWKTVRRVLLFCFFIAAIVFIVLGVWYLVPLLFVAAPVLVNLHEIKTEGTIDEEGEVKAKQVHEEEGLPGVAFRIMKLLSRKSSSDESKEGESK